MGQNCCERGDADADDKPGAGSPHREPVARGPHTEHDSDHHQQHADDRGPWRVVSVGHMDSHGRGGSRGPSPTWPLQLDWISGEGYVLLGWFNSRKTAGL
jgi:hypothetical protein